MAHITAPNSMQSMMAKRTPFDGMSLSRFEMKFYRRKHRPSASVPSLQQRGKNKNASPKLLTEKRGFAAEWFIFLYPEQATGHQVADMRLASIVVHRDDFTVVWN
jgi:hypothetical protein